MTVVEIDPVADPRWAQLTEKRSTSVFQSPDWLAVLVRTYGFPMRARVLLDDMGQPCAGFVYTRVRDFLGSRTVSLPFSDFCDPMVASDGEWAALVDGLCGGDEPVALRCVHNDVALRDDRFSVVGRARWHGIDIKREEEEIWQALRGSARRAIRKAAADGVVVRPAGDKTDLRSFFELHMRVRKHKYQLLAQPYAFFEHIWDQFIVRGQGALLLATVQDTPVAGCLFLEWQGTVYYKLNASDPGYLSSRPNDAVLWEGVKRARARGIDYLDFGLTDWDQEGLIQYKRKYATEEKTITFLRHDPLGRTNAYHREARDLLNRLTGLLVDPRVPDDLSEEAGALLYRYFV